MTGTTNKIQFSIFYRLSCIFCWHETFDIRIYENYFLKVFINMLKILRNRKSQTIVIIKENRYKIK